MTSTSIPAELHALGIKAFGLYTAGGGALSPDDRATLVADLEALYADFDALYHALQSLTALMLYARQQGRHEAAEHITDLIRHTKPRIAVHNNEVQAAIGDGALKASNDMARATGIKTSRAAPPVGSKRPAGAVSLASLNSRPLR